MPLEPPTLPAVFFCLRANSDVDQIVPVIDGLARRGRAAARVIVYDPIKTYRDDFRLSYLRQQYGIAVEHLLELPGVPWHRRCAASIFRSLFQTLVGMQRRLPPLFRRPLQMLLRLLRAELQSMTQSDDCAAALMVAISQVPTGMVVFDHTSHPLARSVTTAARDAGVLTIALPHSVPHLSNMPSTARDPNAEGDESWSALYDYVVLPNLALAERMSKTHNNHGCLAVLGSARFSQDWGAVLDEITPPFDWHPGDTKVLFILSKKGPYVDWGEIDRISLHLSQDPRLSLAIKPHPRTEMSGIPQFTAGPRVRVAPADLPTSSLIQWADLVIFWGSSVIYDALRLRKPTLHLAYPFRLNFDFETYMKSWTVSSFDDFTARLDEFLINGRPTYSEAEASLCMENLIERRDAPTVQRYVDFIEAQLHQDQPQAAVSQGNARRPATFPAGTA